MKLRSLFAAALLVGGALSVAAQNIVLILSDDQGWTGTSVQMDARVRNSVSDLYRTPSLERLAAEGMTFSNAYSPAPNCSPTRMSIQTGKTAARLGATDIIDVVPDEEGRAGIQFFYDAMYVNKPMNVPLPISDLPEEEVTIAEFLKAHDPNYATGHFGKWHMGGENPELHGYDEHNGITTNAPGDQGLPDPKRTDEVTDETVRFIAEHAAAGKPFFVQASYYAVHTPVLAKAETVEEFNGLIVPEPPRGGPFGRFVNLVHSNTVYAGMTADLDAGVGRILDALDEHGLAGSTYVIYTSDNGGESDLPVTSNVPLAWGKTHVWEGGIRVPLFIRGPGIDGGTRSDVPAIGYDFFATIADWVGATAPLPENQDGGSLHGVLANGGEGAVERGTEALVWYYGAYRNMKQVAPQTAIRRGNHKLIWELDSGRTYLYDLDLDLSETTDLSAFRPEVAASLHEELKSYLAAVGTTLPTHNPDYDPAADRAMISVTRPTPPPGTPPGQLAPSE
ncbi:MAG: sulfatase [Gammaproteobacteria bacterium]|nr:sulfatase [Gammaproteobacteria bacterium]